MTESLTDFFKRNLTVISIYILNSLVCITMPAVMQSVHIYPWTQWKHVTGRANKEETSNVHTCKVPWRCYNKYSRPSLHCKSPYHQVPISCSHVCLCERACVFPSLFYSPARSISQSGSYSVAGEEEWKPGDRLRHTPIHYSSAVSERIYSLNLLK